MKTNLIVLLLIAVLFSGSIAQEKSDTLKIFKTNSLQFRVYDFISLSSFKGALFSYKYHCSDAKAFRFAVSLNADNWNEEDSRNIFYADTSLLNQKRDHKYWIVQIIVQFIEYLNLQDEIKLFYGVGPYISMSLNNFDTDKVTTSGTNNYYDKFRKNENYQFGLTGSIGLEWFFKNNMSLHAEYGFNSYYFYENYESSRIYDYFTDPDRIEDRKNTSKGWGIDDAGALLGLSVYF